MQQAELLRLESQLRVIMKYDLEKGLEYHEDAWKLMEPDEDGLHNSQWQLVLDVRENLKEYSMLFIAYT
jgi:hypothetical protein